MAFVGSAAFGTIKNKAGSDGKNLLDARVNQDTFRGFIDQALSAVTGCSPNIHDIYDQFPKWIRERDSESNFMEFFQYYYDWLYCKTELGSQYYVDAQDFLNLLNLEGASIDVIKSYASSYAADFPKDKIGNINGNQGITLDNFIEFLQNIRTSFYQTKGSETSYKYFFKKLYGITLEENAIDYPKKKILRLNGGRFNGWTGLTGSYESVSSLGGSYLNDGVFQDSYFYQEYSYIVDTGKVSDYNDILLEILHPAGLLAFFEQSFAEYVPIGSDGDYTEGVEEGCEIPTIGNYLPYQINATGDLEYCVGCSGSAANFQYFDTDRGISGPTYDMPVHNHPGWALAGETFDTIGDIDIYELAFTGITLSNFLILCSPDGSTSPNEGISACADLGCA